MAGECGLAGRGASADQDVEPRLDQSPQRHLKVLLGETGDVFHLLGAEGIERHGLAEEIGRGVVPETARGEEADGDRCAAINGWRYGDLDPEGLLIYQEFSRICLGALQPWMMDTTVYRRYLSFGRPTVANQLARLRRIDPKPLPELAAAIIDEKIGVEQEVIDLAC